MKFKWFEAKQHINTAGLHTGEMIRAQFEKDPRGFIEKTEDLTDSDFQMIGRLIQQYCFADFCSRRIIDTLYDAALGPEARVGSTLRDNQVFDHLEIVGGLLGPGEAKEIILSAATILKMHRQHRHDFAHWATRRISGQNALISFSKNSKEAKNRDGKSLDAHAIKFGILPMSGMQKEIEKLDRHVHRLSVLAPDLELRIEEIRAAFEQAKADSD